MSNHKDLQKLTAAGLLISLGIIYGDIGTSPLYVFKAIVGSQQISEALILGGVSCIFWTLTLQTTLKYVVITLRADNKGEGGIFSLFSLEKGFFIFHAKNKSRKHPPHQELILSRNLGIKIRET